jgi:hypothetical protein
VFDLKFPKVFTDMLNSVSIVVNLQFIIFMPMGCISTTNFHSSLVGYTMFPLVLFAAMLLLYRATKDHNPAFANRVFRCAKTTFELRLARVGRRTSHPIRPPSPRPLARSYFLAITFLILPSVSIKIFSTWACVRSTRDINRLTPASPLHAAHLRRRLRVLLEGGLLHRLRER